MREYVKTGMCLDRAYRNTPMLTVTFQRAGGCGIKVGAGETNLAPSKGT